MAMLCQPPTSLRAQTGPRPSWGLIPAVARPHRTHSRVKVGFVRLGFQSLVSGTRASPTAGTMQCHRAEQEQPRTVKELITALATSVSASAASCTNRYMVSVAGAPGSGKTYLADAVVAAVNASAPGHRPVRAVAVPMDGFHLYRRQLDAMPDPALAHAKRGAHWTFDPARFVHHLQRLRQGGKVTLPSFDHALGDPIEDDITVEATDNVIIVEGLYTLLEQEPWCEVRAIVDEAWYVECDLEDALAAVIARQVANGASQKAAEQRVNSNDRQNGELVMSAQGRATRVLPRLPLL